MLNKFPLWKYLMILAVMAVGVIYSLPNLYPDDPAVQITGAKTSTVLSQAELDKALKALASNNIDVKASKLGEKNALLRLNDMADQLPAKEAIRRVLGDDFVVALNLAPTTPKWLLDLSATPMKLGLDLSGGVHFLLEVDMDKAVSARLKISEGEIKSMLRKEKLRYRSLPPQDNAFQLGFRSEAELEKARSLIATQFGLDFDLTTSTRDQLEVLRVAMSQSKYQEIREYAIKQNLTTVRNRVNELGVSEPLVQRQGANRIVVELPGVQDTAEAKRILGKTANLEFRLQADAEASKASTETFERRDGGLPASLERSVILTGDQVTDAQASFDENGRPQVNIRLDGRGGDMMNRATRNNVGRSMAVLFIEQQPLTRYVKEQVNGVEKEVAITSFKEEKKIISLATIQSPLGSSFRITGLDGPGESSELALLLRAGGLAAPMHFAEERTIGPSLGAENIALGVEAAKWGLLFVAIFMVALYRFFGILASIALGFNMLMLVAFMSIFNATLTLPGIAGIVLTMGMAVDANVLIFSRIREEIANGMSIQRAIHEGFDRATSAIVDGNLTTLLVGIILFAMGSGPIKGFAVTLSIGILTSMFTAIVVTRAMVNLLFGGRDIKKLWI
ncbi:protein translocase subunit SecD [Atopomonas sediminilitoris]|uniref:protein translocase subunit SecD n=1 Tax=Atopomonas sediminilitoris TaxID=2919919 RepID=UPI001F4DC567|nr:protein translocase subunit SecD [Atopomonas sediminilitoris]MCJ8168718.1 protein translocase subunit SecD [Atopomonas sediminilitoris]